MFNLFSRNSVQKYAFFLLNTIIIRSIINQGCAELYDLNFAPKRLKKVNNIIILKELR